MQTSTPPVATAYAIGCRDWTRDERAAARTAAGHHVPQCWGAREHHGLLVHCTRPLGHDGPCVAGSVGGAVRAVWPNGDDK